MTPAGVELEALRAAIYLFHLPAGLRAAREQTLPTGVPLLLEVAAGDDDAANACADRLERPVSVIRQAAEFYVEHVVMIPNADAFRTLAARRDATDVELRRNMAMLLRWAHPDVDRQGDRTVYAGRVTRAWEELKTPERRAAYEAANPPRAPARTRASRAPRSRGGQATSIRLAASNGGKPAKLPSRTRLVIGQALRFLLGSRRTHK